MRGAGGTPGGSWEFTIGLIMASAGMYMLLNSMVLHSGFGMGVAIWTIRGVGLTSGAMLIPFIVGIGLIFYNAKNPAGWVFAGGALTAVIVGVIMSLQISLRSMTMLEMIIIVVLLAGGLGLFAKSLTQSGDR